MELPGHQLLTLSLVLPCYINLNFLFLFFDSLKFHGEVTIYTQVLNRFSPLYFLFIKHFLILRTGDDTFFTF